MTIEQHIIPMFLNRAANYGKKEVFRYKDSQNRYRSMNWTELSGRIDNILSSLHALGVRKGENVGIFSQNMPQWLMTDLAIMALGAVVVPFYATASMEQLRYIVKETGMKVMFAGDDEQLEKALALMKEGSTLNTIVSFRDNPNLSDADPSSLLGFHTFLDLSRKKAIKLSTKDRLHEYRSTDMATIIYTSGTTGEPKGVMLRQDNLMYCFGIHDQRLNVNSTDVSLCFLPLSHVFERMWSYYLLHRGAVNVFLENPKEVINTLAEVKPTVMCTVPRFFDKTWAGIQEEASKWPAIKQKIFSWSVKQGLQAIEYKARNKEMPWELRTKLGVADRLVLKKLRGIFGGNIRVMPCAGAAINKDILKFFHAVGLFVNYGYGATETMATVSCFREDEYDFSTCGSVMPGVEVKIGENNEILVKGRTVFYGYYRKEQETAAVLKNGWFHTGDEGYLDDKGNLIMVDRIKDLMKTSVGKYVSPQKLEMLLSQDELVDHITVVGDNRQYVSALVVPAMDKLKKLAAQKNISFKDETELVSSEKVYDLFQKRFDDLQKDITPYERVVKFALLAEPFSIEAGTMTSTLKLKRRTIEKTYRQLIDSMYT
jgi:long-chain acyl-CoA synthetase